MRPCRAVVLAFVALLLPTPVRPTTDVTPPIVSQAVAVGFPVTPTKTILVSTNQVDVTFSEAVDPATAQLAGNYAYSGPVTRTVLSAVVDGLQPELVHLTLSAPVGPSAVFNNITVTGVQDLSANVIVPNDDTNVGSYFIQALSFQARMTQRLCSNMFALSDSFFVEGNLAPLTAGVGDNARLTDPNADSVYTGLVPMAMPRDRTTGKAEATLEWNFGHRPTQPELEFIGTRMIHLSSDNGPGVTLAASWDDDPATCVPASLFSFEQLDFRLGEASYVQNSDIGACRFDYVAFPSAAYLNVALRHPETLQPVWVIRNFPLPDSGRAAPVESFAARFPLSHVGVASGTPAGSLTFSHLLTGAPLADADTALWYPTLLWQPPVLVGQAEVTEQGYDGGPGPDIALPALLSPGWHFPVQVRADTTWYSWIGCVMPNVELDSTANGPMDKYACVPAACANSLKWLDNTNATFQLPELRQLYEQLSYLMGRDQADRPVRDSMLVVAKLDLIEAHKLPIKVKFQGKRNQMKKDIKSTSGLTSATCRDTVPGSFPKWGFLAAEAADGEDLEIGGGQYHTVDGQLVRVPGIGHCMVVTSVVDAAGNRWIGVKDDTNQRGPGGTQERGIPLTDTTGSMKTNGPPVTVGGVTKPSTWVVESVVSESYDPTPGAGGTALPDTHTFSAYCQEFRRTIPPRTKVTISMPNRGGCGNSTISFLSRAHQPPKWFNAYEWNFRQGKKNEYVNKTSYPVTISIHNDDLHASDPAPYLITLNMTPLPPPGQGTAPSLPEEESTPSNPDEWGGFSLGGTSGGPDEFGSPPGPNVIFDASVGRDLSQVPGRMGNGVQNFAITRPIPVWNQYWAQVALQVVVSAVHSPGTLLVNCPSTGFAAPIPITQPGAYTANLGTVPQTSQFDLTLSAVGGLDLEFDAIGVPSLVNPVVGVEQGFVPRVAGLRNLGPTPTRGHVSLRFDVPRSGRVEAEIFDVRGRRIATVLSATLDAGSHGRTWNGFGDGGRPVPSGVYFCRMKFGRESHVTRIVINR